MVTVGILAYLDRLNVPGVLIAAFLAALGSVFYSPAASTLLLDILPQDELVRGRSLYSGMTSLIEMAGTALSGVMVAFLGVPLIVVINGLSNLYAAASELLIHVPKTVQQGTSVTLKGILQDAGKAVSAIFSDNFLCLFIPSALIINFLGAGPLTLVLPFCMEKGFAVDMYGYLVTVYTTGALLSVLVLGIVKLKPAVRYWIMGLSFSCSVFFFVAAYLSKQFLPMCVMTFLGAFLNAAGNALFDASMMQALPEENRGAILGFIQSASIGGSALSAVVYGLLGDLFPLSFVFAVGTGISLLPMVYMCFHRRTKEFILNH
jgi:MFS family permease